MTEKLIINPQCIHQPTKNYYDSTIKDKTLKTGALTINSQIYGIVEHTISILWLFEELVKQDGNFFLRSVLLNIG